MADGQSITQPMIDVEHSSLYEDPIEFNGNAATSP